MNPADILALKIARCAELPLARTHAGHPCHRIACVQSALGDREGWQVPEPWRGDLQRAPLLFVSSNPSIDEGDDCPWNHDTDDAITSYFNTGSIARHFPRSTDRGGVRSATPVRFWVSVHTRAKELYGSETVRHGVDYAITEVVHCKSSGEIGVGKAREHCAERYLREVLHASSAAVVVALGTHAVVALNAQRLPGSVLRIDLPHPNARARRTAAACLPPEVLQGVRSALGPRTGPARAESPHDCGT